MSRTKQKLIAVVAGSVLALTLNGSVLAAGQDQGNSGNAPGQKHAQQNCDKTIDRQTDKGVAAGGGSKAGVPAPTNCDHFFNP